MLTDCLSEQGITRLPRTHAIVFTLHKYFAPISALKARAPEACAMLHRAFDVTPPDKLAYSLGEDEVRKPQLALAQT